MTSASTAARAAVVAGLALVGLAGIHMTHGTFDDQLTSVVDYANDSLFTIGLLLSIPAVLALRTERDAPRVPTALVAGGQAAVAVGVIAGLVTGESPSWFAAVGVPGNLVAFAGFLALARWSRRSRTYGWPVTLLLALAVPVGLVGGELGGSLVPAALWFVLARDLAPGRPRLAAQPA